MLILQPCEDASRTSDISSIKHSQSDSLFQKKILDLDFRAMYDDPPLTVFPRFSFFFLSASVLLKQAEELAAKYPNTIPVTLDVSSQEGHLDSLVKDHDLVIRYSVRKICCYM